MKLHELIKNNSWLSVRTILLSLYPDQEKNIAGYERVFFKLREIQPKESCMEIVIEEYYDEISDIENAISVHGKLKNGTEEQMSLDYAIEFEPWANWLGMFINENTLQEFTELEIIGHCLYEMTFVGYNEIEIQGYKENIEERIEEYKKVLEEKRIKFP